ncbi:uncharacterized protein PFLUO_LOCUS7847 [Penicillium psychrofluorescens]|uniref:uncharacterized protein n=1 Tax=Penicillium psychrofluorescens TaxID=3158075 RepID=UPI003CCDBFB8
MGRLNTLLLLCGLSWTAVAQQAISSAPVPVTGVMSAVNTQTGERPSRLHIADLQKTGGAPWDLYIQAISAFQAVPEDQENSWFQVLGIHGLPFESWNGVGNVKGAAITGYCPHNEVLFGSWHRPYVALFEQEVIRHAKTIANQYTGSQKAKYVNAAQSLRIPFWDWAVSPQIPEVLSETQITVNTPTGQKTIHNPLQNYQFQNWPFKYSYFTGSIAQYPHTMRCPSTTNSKAVSRTSTVDANLARDASYLKSAVYNVFTRAGSYAEMVTDSQGGYNFESPHNNIHVDVGGSSPMGHMTNLGWSAFDPIFMLHHANVDRLIAMWQATHPNKRMFENSFKLGSPLWGSAKGMTYTEDYVLKPFYKPGGSQMWTSREVVSTRSFGYTYPELPDWTMSSTQLQQHVTSVVNNLYGPSNSVSKRSMDAQPETLTQYVLKIAVDRSDFEGPAMINSFFDGSFSGSMSLLTMPMSEDSSMGGMSYANLPLQGLNGVDGLGAVGEGPLAFTASALSSIAKFFSKALSFNIQHGNGSALFPSDVPSLTVALEVLHVVPAASVFEFPTVSKTTTIPLDISSLFELL